MPVPGPACSIFNQYYPHGIFEIMISTIFRHSLLISLFPFKPEFLKPDPVVTGMWLCRFPEPAFILAGSPALGDVPGPGIVAQEKHRKCIFPNMDSRVQGAP